MNVRWVACSRMHTNSYISFSQPQVCPLVGLGPQIVHSEPLQSCLCRAVPWTELMFKPIVVEASDQKTFNNQRSNGLGHRSVCLGLAHLIRDPASRCTIIIISTPEFTKGTSRPKSWLEAADQWLGILPHADG
jgi:hypothetical protein